MSLCRLCLSCDPGEDIFAPINGDEGTTYSDQLEEIFQIKLELVEHWPSIACHQCIDRLEQIKEFKLKIISSQEEFLKNVTRIDFLQDSETVVEEVNDIVRNYAKTEEYIKEEEEVYEADDHNTENQNSDMSIGIEEISQEAFKTDNESIESDEDYTRSRSISKAQKRKWKRREQRRTLKPVEEDPRLEAMLCELRLLNCIECTTQFPTLYEFHSHAKKIHKKPTNRMAEILCCERKFYGTLNIYDHMRYHIDKDAFKCPDCGKRFKCAKSLKKHTPIHTAIEDRQFKCNDCGKRFPTLLKLNTHAQLHLPDDQRQFHCPHCEKKFIYPGLLNDHVKAVHEQIASFVCEVCGKGFSSKGYLRQHREGHEQTESKECDICGKQYLKLEYHKRRMHSDRTMVNCEICGKEYSSRTLSRHMKSVHSNINYACSVCHKVFSMEKNLKTHMDIHLGVKYKCHFCEHLSTNISNRTKHHMQKHPQELLAYRESRDKEIKIKAI